MAKLSTNSQRQATAGSPWIYGPALDLIVGCGAWSAPLLLVSYFSIASSTRTWSVAFYVLALFFNYPHYMATIYRAYHRAEDFQKYRIFTVHATALIVLTLLLSHFWLRLLPWIFTIYLTWSPWHYSGQNYGLFMMFARRAGANPAKAERRALYGAFVASYLILFLGFHSGASSDPLFVSLGIPPAIAHWEQVALSVVFLGLAVFGLSRVARDTGWRKLLPSLTLFFVSVSLVPAANGNFANQGAGNSAKPLQFGRVGRDALRAIPLDYELLRPPGSVGRIPSQLASHGLLRRSSRGRNRFVCPRTMACQPRFPP
jgi:hypothetical protein